jgi:hypothetical protein
MDGVLPSGGGPSDCVTLGMASTVAEGASSALQADPNRTGNPGSTYAAVPVRVLG